MCREKRYLTATEVENEMQKVRNESGFKGKAETQIVKNILETAKQNNHIGDKILMVLNPTYIHMPTWQRRTDIMRATEIGKHYNKNKWELPKVICTNHKLYCVDGKHRIYGAFIGGQDYISVEILDGITETEAIELFISQTRDRKKMTPVDIYPAAIQAKIPEYLTLKNLCNTHHVNVKGDYCIENPIGEFTAITEGLKLSKTPELLEDILQMIEELQWNGSETGNAYGAKIIRVMKMLYGYYAKHTKEMENILLQHCKGSEYFMKNMINRTQAGLFDLLSDTIKTHLKKTIIFSIPKKTQTAN